jgi:CheY-like chemotaxis protein
VSIINDILDYTKIEEGKMALDIKSFNIREAINEIIILFDVTAKQKGLELDFYIDEDIPEFLEGDIVRLRQVISNLVGNAIKFTPSGSIEMKVEDCGWDSRNIKLLFSVKDTGIGIEEDQKSLLFGRFTQLDSSYTKKYQGTGLGLAISKEIIELMEGEIWCDSKIGIGTTFYFSLSLKVTSDVDNEKSGNTIEDDGKSMIRQKKVMVVDDDDISRLIIVKILEKRGISVFAANNGKDAIEIFKREKLDLIILDIQMPVLDGISTVTKIRDIEASTGTHTPVIASTAYVLPEDKEKFLNLGMDDYLGKPIDIASMKGKVEKYLYYSG